MNFFKQFFETLSKSGAWMYYIIVFGIGIFNYDNLGGAMALGGIFFFLIMHSIITLMYLSDKNDISRIME